VSTEELPGPDLCSAKGCRAPAAWQLLWNNPKIHTPHRESLESFLGARGFLKETVAHEPPE
jgi:hypothetical protein